MGAYFFLFPYSRVIVVIPILIFPFFFELPAVIYLGVWALTQVFSGTLSIASGDVQVGGVAWWAHVGGFGAGLILHFLFVMGRAPRRLQRDEYGVEIAWAPQRR
jgi:membrane associated rhomboid family serine protease